MGNARGAAIGDSLASILEMAGYDVEREFYVNDAGNQIEKFATTLNALYLMELGYDAEFPEDGYHGADLPVPVSYTHLSMLGKKDCRKSSPLILRVSGWRVEIPDWRRSCLLYTSD